MITLYVISWSYLKKETVQLETKDRFQSGNLFMIAHISVFYWVRCSS